MISFFEFLNTCSPLRAVSYMVFILLVMFFSYSLIESLFQTMFGKVDKEEKSDKAEDYYTGPTDDEEKNE